MRADLYINTSEFVNNDGNGVVAIVDELEVHNSTFSGNGVAGLTFDALNYTSSADPQAVISNSSFSGNHTGISISGNFAYGGLTAKLESVTIAENIGGGGLDESGVFLEVENSLISGNTSAGTPADVQGISVVDDFAYTLVGDTSNLTVAELAVLTAGTGNQIDVEPLLGPLQDNGGPTFTHALLAGSPAIDAGDPAFASPPDFDQRGAPFTRVHNGRIDIGAYEVQLPSTDVDLDGMVTGFDFLQLQATGGNLSQWVTEYGLEVPPEAASLVVTTDQDIVSPFDHETSLREAVAFANESGTDDTIAFDPSLHGGTIVLTQGDLEVNGATTILGPGAELLTIDASGNDPTPNSTLTDGDDSNDGDGSRVFALFGPQSSPPPPPPPDPPSRDVAASSSEESYLTIAGLTLTGGDIDTGGAIDAQGRVRLFDSRITGNNARLGGGIRSQEIGTNTGKLLIEDSTLDHNEASFVGAAIRADFADVTILRSSLVNNKSQIYGGAVSAFHVELTVEDSLIANNTSRIGAGLSLAPTRGSSSSPPPTTIVRNSTISGNHALEVGGAIKHDDGFSSIPAYLTIENSTITDNRANLQGGGIYVQDRNALVSLSSTVLTENVGGNISFGLGDELLVDVRAELNFRAVGNLLFRSSETRWWCGPIRSIRNSNGTVALI